MTTLGQSTGIDCSVCFVFYIEEGRKILLNIKIGSVNVGIGGLNGCLVYLPELIKDYDIIGIQEANIISPKEDNEAIKIEGFNTFTAKRKEGNEQHRVGRSKN